MHRKRSASTEGWPGANIHSPTSSFVQEIEQAPGGASINKCIQCGICTASCVIANKSETYRPRALIQKILIGKRQEVLTSDLIWKCMSCRMCEERCQEGVSPSEIFQAVRHIAVKEGYIPKAYAEATATVLHDGWMLKDAYSDFIEEDREDLGLETDLKWDNSFAQKVKARYLSGE